MTVKSVMECDICGLVIPETEEYVDVVLTRRARVPIMFNGRGPYYNGPAAKVEAQVHISCVETRSGELFGLLSERYAKSVEEFEQNFSRTSRIPKFDSLPIIEDEG